MQSLHDNKVKKYKVEFEKKQISITTINNYNKEIQVIFEGVLTHMFENEITDNIIFDIEKRKIDNFIEENLELLETKKQYGWPTIYKNIEELNKKLVNDNYNYFIINSSYGLCGWILAKDVKYIE